MRHFGFSNFLAFLCLFSANNVCGDTEAESNLVGEIKLPHQATIIESTTQKCQTFDEKRDVRALIMKPINVKSILINNTIPFCITPESSEKIQNITQLQQFILNQYGVENYVKAGPPTQFSQEKIYGLATFLNSFSYGRSVLVYSLPVHIDLLLPGGRQNIPIFFEYLSQHYTNFNEIPNELLRMASEDPVKFNMTGALNMFSEFQKQAMLTNQLIIAIDQAKAKYPLAQ